MLELKNITKVYGTASEEVHALKGVSIKFRESEFVSILGQSGCGKTTLLNIIGGLDRYTSGDLIINGKSTTKFKDRDWDAYRNYKVGFVFQSYNLISHQTILSNVELALTIGGVSKKERTQRAIKALEEVGLKDQIHKKPNQLSGGQMQRVAIARALVNNPDIILADEPTGALDTKTSVQVMEILKNISKTRLIIMVTHNPELAEAYSTRIIKILDGLIIEDSNPISETENLKPKTEKKMGKTSMKFWTAFRLSLNNLLTKKGRTVLVAFAGSIGIIGIALIQSVSNGFQAYVDHIQEDTLTSYPLTIMQETTDVTGTLLSMISDEGERKDSHEVKEEQYISKMLANLTTNDLKSFDHYMKEHYSQIDDDISSVKYSYSIDPLIYTRNQDQKISKLNPNQLFQSSFSGSTMMSNFSSIYSQMTNDREMLEKSYDVLAGKWPENYDEMIIVLSEPNVISDLLVYSLGIRDIEELKNVVTKIMSGEKVELNNETIVTSYEELMKTELKLIMPTDQYKYNTKYDIYENMTEDEAFLNDLYDKSISLKIVGIVSPKEGVTTMALNPGVAYTEKLIDYIIDYASQSEIVKKQMEDEEVDILSGSRFDSKKNKVGIDFKDLISIDTEQLQNAFQINIDQNQLQEETAGYMEEIANAINTDTTTATTALKTNFTTLANGMFASISGEIGLKDIDTIVDKYLNGKEATSIFKELETSYVVPQDVFKTMYAGLLKSLLQIYINSYSAANALMNADLSNIPMNTTLPEMTMENLNIEELQQMAETAKQQMQSNLQNSNPTAKIDPEMQKTVMTGFLVNPAIQNTFDTMANAMTEAVMKKVILTKVAELTGNLTSSFATAFNVDQEKISSAFRMKMTEEEITRIVNAMLSKTESNAKTNLISFGYQDKEEPTYISFYFKSFDGKEHFKEFLDQYNEKAKEQGEEDKEINYTDTTGILMNSVKTIVNAVTYVLIAFVSISLVVSSIMIGIITYISVYERTKEIGILRAIGASKRNISSIFNAETFIIGLLSGLFGIGITYLLVPIINTVLHHFTGNIPLNAAFYAQNAIYLIILSVILTLIGGLIPAKAAAKRDPVIALRTE